MRMLTFILCLCMPGLLAAAELADSSEMPPLLGSWEGAMVIGQQSSNLAFTFSQNNGEYQAALISTAMGIYGMPADAVELDGPRLVIRLPRIDGVFTGRIRLDESVYTIIRIDGDRFPYAEMLPVTLVPGAAPSC
ncbi:MAG: hypothetical protein RL120_02875 [Gammaproteobacteria bacterium]